MLCSPERTQKVTKGMVTKMPQAISQAKYAPGVGVQFMGALMMCSFISRVFRVP